MSKSQYESNKKWTAKNKVHVAKLKRQNYLDNSEKRKQDWNNRQNMIKKKAIRWQNTVTGWLDYSYDIEKFLDLQEALYVAIQRK